VARLSSNQFQAALDDFRAAAQLNPRSFAALVNQGHVLADRMRDPDAALQVMTRVTQFYPEYSLGRINRAVLLARLGKRTDAHTDVEQALRLTPNDPEIIYRAACVYSLTSVIEPADKTKALAHMQSAITNGYKRIKLIETDRDLDAIRDTPRFREITEAAVSLFQ
jgi:Flp pilus assembly protein TadD